jgi:hypothetical protein
MRHLDPLEEGRELSLDLGEGNERELASPEDLDALVTAVIEALLVLTRHTAAVIGRAIASPSVVIAFTG